MIIGVKISLNATWVVQVKELIGNKVRIIGNVITQSRFSTLDSDTPFNGVNWLSDVAFGY